MDEYPQERVDPAALLQLVPASARRVLDCGAASGALPRLLKERGVSEVAGIAYGGPAAAGPLPFDDDYFDCITAVDILPRLREPETFLKELRRVLSPHGVLLATAPNLQYYRTVVMLAQGHWTYANDGILARDHLRFYTGVELVELLKSANFEVRALTRHAGEDPARVPRDSAGYIHFGRIRIGPLSDVDYQLYLISQYLAMATRADVASL